MPSPSILEMFTSSISTIQQLLTSSNLKTEVDESPYVSSIQSLNGLTPGEKLKDYNNIIRELIAKLNNRGELVDVSEIREISPTMTPLVRATVGVKLGMIDLVVEGLLSEDAIVARKALTADWFFDGTTISADFMIERVIRLASLRTRLDIVKKLSLCLRCPDQAEQLFLRLLELYGTETGVRLLINCSENFIINAILTYRIALSAKSLSALYDKYPELALRYLQLGNKKNSRNADERRLHEISLNEYDVFLPRLVRKHAREFLELYKVTPAKTMKLSGSGTERILKEARDAIKEEPQVFLKICSLKLVTKMLDKESFEVMYENLFPANIDEFNFNEMLDYLAFCQHADKIRIMKEKFQKVYKRNLLEDERKLDLPRLLKLLNPEERKNYARFMLNKHEKNSTDFNNKYISYLPPAESLPTLKEKFNACTTLEEREDLLACMIQSCGIYNSKDGLFDCLEYYYSRHKNEESLLLCKFFECLRQDFDLKSLDARHWNCLKNIVNYAYVKNQLFKSNFSLVESILEDALWAFQNFDQDYLEKLCDMIVECKIEHRQSATTWNVLKENPKLEKKFIAIFFQIIPIRYPSMDPIWSEKGRRLVLALSLIKTINDYNTRNCFAKLTRRASKQSETLNNSLALNGIKLDDYPWIMKLAEEFFAKFDDSDFKYRKRILLRLLKRNAPHFYDTKVDEHCPIRDIDSGHALALLNSEPRKILANWSDYLAEARKRLHAGSRAARRFVAATKWYHDIPVKFIEKCLLEIREEGSVLVLGLLLEGSAFERIVAPYLPGEERLNLSNPDAKARYEFARSVVRAAGWTNPPVSFDFVASLCRGDYVGAAIGALSRRARRAPVARVLEFGRGLAHRPIALKKPAIRTVQSCATLAQFRDFLADMWTSQDSPAMRERIARMIFEMFAGSPCDGNLALVGKCLDGLSASDQASLERYSDLASVDPQYVDEYLVVYLNKIDELTKDNLGFRTRRNCLCLALDSIDDKIARCLAEDTSRLILQRYLFDSYSLEICRAAQNFAVGKYLLAATTNFEDRINNVMEILASTTENFDKRHPKRRRFYPTNYTLQEFFADTLKELSARGSERNLEIVENLLKIFEEKLYPWQEPLAYLAMNIYKEYLLAETPKKFGTRCSRRCSDLIGDFSANEAVITDIANCINDFIANNFFRDEKYPEIKLSIIEGLLEDDNFYGSLLSTKLLDDSEVGNYDGRYDSIIQVLHQKRNETIQYHLYKHINRIKYEGSDEVEL